MARRRTSEQIAALVEEYPASGLTRAQYGAQKGIPKSTLDRYLALRKGGQRLVRVKVDRRQQSEGGFVLWLANGRRIETGWGFGDAELARLIRVAEGV